MRGMGVEQRRGATSYKSVNNFGLYKRLFNAFTYCYSVARPGCVMASGAPTAKAKYVEK